MTKITNNIGDRILALAYHLGGVGILAKQGFVEIFSRPINFYLITEQIYAIGVKSFGLVFVTAVSTGMVMALQFGVGLSKFGAKIVGASIVREMGPVFCSLMLAARVGAGIASEIGSMTVTQQIDAIRALGTSPIKRIVVPRIIACLIAIPLLCALADVSGILGSVGIEVWELGLDPKFCLEKIYATLTITDFMIGLGKTFFFAIFITLPATYFGLNVRGGTQGVGSATTRAVVVSSMLILVGDFFLTKAFFIIFER